MSYSLYDAAVTPCIQQLGALAGIIDKAAAHCAANKIEESALLQDRLYPDMFCLARQIRQSADFAMNTGGRLAGVAPSALPSVDDASFAAASTSQQRVSQKTAPRRDLHKRFRWLLRWPGQSRKGRNLPFASKLAYALPLPRSCPSYLPRWAG